jgi:hypothetical protein
MQQHAKEIGNCHKLEINKLTNHLAHKKLVQPNHTLTYQDCEPESLRIKEPKAKGIIM